MEKIISTLGFFITLLIGPFFCGWLQQLKNSRPWHPRFMWRFYRHRGNLYRNSTEKALLFLSGCREEDKNMLLPKFIRAWFIFSFQFIWGYTLYLLGGVFGRVLQCMKKI